MLRKAWALIRDTVEGFVADEAMTRGAAIACYAMFSIAPLLVVAVAIAGLAFGEEAVRSAVAEQLRALVGREGGEAVQAMVRGVGEGGGGGGQGSGGVPALVSVGVLLVTASGVFAELHAGALRQGGGALPRHRAGGRTTGRCGRTARASRRAARPPTRATSALPRRSRPG